MLDKHGQKTIENMSRRRILQGRGAFVEKYQKEFAEERHKEPDRSNDGKKTVSRSSGSKSAPIRRTLSIVAALSSLGIFSMAYRRAVRGIVSLFFMT